MSEKIIPGSLAEQVTLAEIEHLQETALQLETKLKEVRQTWLQTREIKFAGPMGPEVAAEVIGMLGHIVHVDADGEKKAIHIILNSLGGSFIDAFALYDFVNTVKSLGYKFSIQVTGAAGVHALVVLQAADERIITPNSSILITAENFRGTNVNTSNAGHLVEFYKSLELDGRQIIINRSNITLEWIKAQTGYGRVWRLSAEEALELGLVDQIGTHIQSAPPVRDLSGLLPAPGDSLKDKKRKAEIRVALGKAAIARFDNEQEMAGKKGKVLFFMDVNPESCHSAQEAFHQFARELPEGQPVEMLINSPGGSVADGLGLCDIIDQVEQMGHPVNTTCFGCAASMGGILLQGATHGKKKGIRRIGRHGRILIHRASAFLRGNADEIDDASEFMSRLEMRVWKRVASHSNLTIEELRERSDGKDWWVNAEEALALGLVDEII